MISVFFQLRVSCDQAFIDQASDASAPPADAIAQLLPRCVLPGYRLGVIGKGGDEVWADAEGQGRFEFGETRVRVFTETHGLV